MNKRIRELLIEETIKNNPIELSLDFFKIQIIDDKGTKTVASIPTEFCDKFAETIINECKKAIDPKGDLCSTHEFVWREACMKMIDDRFGITE